MTQKFACSTSASWAHFRFSVVGSLLSAPVPRGELQATLQALADKTWSFNRPAHARRPRRKGGSEDGGQT
jgi:hypothetical protein